MFASPSPLLLPILAALTTLSVPSCNSFTHPISTSTSSSAPVRSRRCQQCNINLCRHHRVGANHRYHNRRLPWSSSQLLAPSAGARMIPNQRSARLSSLDLPLRMSTKSNTGSGGQNNERNDEDMVQIAIDEFISTLQASLDNESFESFTLKGPSAPRKRRRKNKDNDGSADDADAAAASLERQRESLRGKYKTISGRLVLLQERKKTKKKTSHGGNNRKIRAEDETVDSGSLYIQTTIKYHLATDVAKNWKVESRRINSERRTEVETGLRQLFSTAMGGNDDITDDDDDAADRDGAPLSEWGDRNMNGGELGILSGELVTSDCGVHKLNLQPRRKASFRLSKKKQSTQKQKKDGDNTSTNDESRKEARKDLSHLSHDRSKNVPLPPSSEFFQKLGVTDERGKPANGMASKLRQCQKFVEIVGNLVENGSASRSNSPPSRVRVIDMGCGRGYLTFSLHSYLASKFGAMQDEIGIETQGIDRRPKLIEEINGIAQDLGGAFDTLNFIEGTIGNTKNLFGCYIDNSLDILIALHACDTATDDALWFAMGKDADIIVTAPCCQHELRPQIDSLANTDRNHPLSDILRHAIYRERATETVTDAMRAILLEIAGYNTQVFEFIGGEHTAKNVMIAATKMKRRQSDGERGDKRRRLIDLAKLHGIKRQRLATLMGESILPTGGENELKTVRRNLSGMAPL